MNEMTITFKKHKGDYIIIIRNFYFPNNIIMYFELDINKIKDIMAFINMLQNSYKISSIEIDIDNGEIEMSHTFENLLRDCPF